MWVLPDSQFKVAIRLIVDAAWQDSWIRYDGTPRILQRGQVLLSERGMASRLRMSRKTIRLALSKLCKMDFIRIEKGAHKPTIVTVINYCRYQDIPTPEGPSGGTTRGTSVGPIEQKKIPSVSSPAPQVLPGLALVEEPQPGPVAGKRKRKAKGSVEGLAPDPRHREFVSIFARVFRDHREAPPAFARGDFAALKRWLHDQPQLTAEEFEFKCREAHRSTGFKNACSLQKLCTSEVWNQLTPYAPVRLGPVRETNREWKSPEEWGIPDEQSAEAIAMGEIGTLGEPLVRSAPVAVASPSTASREAGDTLSLPACPEW